MTEEIENLSLEIRKLEETQSRLIELGYQSSRLENWKTLGYMLGIFVGIFAICSVLYDGLSYYSAVGLVVGAFFLKVGIDRDKSIKDFRDQYHENISRLSDMKDRYSRLTFVPETLEESERRWRELLSGKPPNQA